MPEASATAPIAAPSLAAPSLAAPLEPRRSFAQIFLANALAAATQFALLAAITHWTNPLVVGYYGFGLALATPILLASGMALRELAMTDAARQFSAATYVRLRYVSSTAAWLTTVAVAAALAHDRNELLTVAAVALAKSIESLSEIRYGLLQREHNHGAVARSIMARAVLGVACAVPALWLTHRVPVAMLAIAAVWLAFYLAYDRRQPLAWAAAAHTNPAAGAPDSPRALAAIAWPMGMVAAIVALQINIPRLFVRHLLGPEALGRFTTMTAVLAITSTVLVALGQTSGSRLAALWLDRSYRAFAALTLRLIAIMAGIAGLGVALALTIGDFIVVLVFGEDYRGLHHLLAQICLAAGFFGVSGILGVAALALRTFRLVSALQVAAAVLAMAVCARLIPNGLGAAGWSVVIIAAISCLPSTGAFLYAWRNMKDAAGHG